MRLGKYQLLRRLAVGGMAEIYLARSTGIEGFQKLLVLKRILPQHAANEDFISMFLNEARLAATLHHPNIAQTYDMGVEDGNYYFTMEYVHGEDMRNVLRSAARAQKRLPLDHSLSIIMGTCAGLHHAHEQVGPDGEPLGLVHRDVSPSNILVTFDGTVKVVDFGIAKATTGRVETRVGTLKGKIAYMSPEQCRGERLDRRSDVFAIGILLYEFTTGTRLFKGENEFAILTQIVNDDAPAPSTRRADYPPALEAIVMKALRRNREQRYASAQELQLELEEFTREQRLRTSPVSVAGYMKELFGVKPDPWRELAAAGALADSKEAERKATGSGVIAGAAQGAPKSIAEMTTRAELPRPAADGSNSSILERAAGESANVAGFLRPKRSYKRAAAVVGATALLVAIALFAMRGRGGGGDTHAAAPVGDVVQPSGAAATPRTGPADLPKRPEPSKPEPSKPAPAEPRPTAAVPAPAPVTPAPAAVAPAAPVPLVAASVKPAKKSGARKPAAQKPSKPSKDKTVPAKPATPGHKPGWDPDSALPPG